MEKILFPLCFILAYLIGAVPFGLLIGKLHGVDIRNVGSGNIGATNVTRAVGKTAGRICFLLDFLKGTLPTAAAQLFHPELPWLAIGCGAAAILGHMFPVYLKFKGGKGVSTAAGVALALAPYPLLCAAAVWVAVFLIWRYVSLASIAAAAALPTAAIVFALFDIGSPTAGSAFTLVFFCAAAALAIFRHRENIKRLFAGTESRFSKK